MNAASFISDAASPKRPRVLLADDHPAMLEVTAAALAGECCVVGSVGDGHELLAEAERLHPDAIVLDITMPGLDGIEAARQLKRAAATRSSCFSPCIKTRTTCAPRCTRAGPPTSSRRDWPPASSRPSTKPS